MIGSDMFIPKIASTITKTEIGIGTGINFGFRVTAGGQASAFQRTGIIPTGLDRETFPGGKSRRERRASEKRKRKAKTPKSNSLLSEKLPNVDRAKNQTNFLIYFGLFGDGMQWYDN